MRSRSISDEQILATARSCFVEHGPGVSTNTIAAEVGLSQAALFKRFSTKRELLIRALTHDEPQWMRDIEVGPDPRPVPEQMLELLRQISAFFRELMPCISVLSAAGISREEIFSRGPEPGPVRAHRLISEWFQRLLEAGRIGNVAPNAAAAAFLGAVQTQGMLQHALGQAAPEVGDDYLEQVVDMFWHGMAPAEPREREHA